MSTRPTIGVTSYWTPASMPHWDLDAVLVSQGYIDGVHGAGGQAVVLPADPGWAEAPDDALDLLDGLIVVGGDDLDPSLYGAPAHTRGGRPHPRRDAAETALMRRAIERDMPVLGICRGMQLLNVVCGGTLDQHLPDSIDITPHRAADRELGTHAVATVEGTLAARILGPRVQVSSHHHQGVAGVGAGLTVSAHAPDDGVIEAIELPTGRFVLGVLWHPDADPTGTGAPVFAALVDAARVR